MDERQLREALAEYAHDAWSGWMRHQFQQGDTRKLTLAGRLQQVWVMPSGLRRRWRRLMNTPYAQLTEAEKASDRAEADKILAILRGAQPGST